MKNVQINKNSLARHNKLDWFCLRKYMLAKHTVNMTTLGTVNDIKPGFSTTGMFYAIFRYDMFNTADGAIWTGWLSHYASILVYVERIVHMGRYDTQVLASRQAAFEQLRQLAQKSG